MTDTAAWNFQSTRKRRRRRRKMEARDYHLGPAICMALLPVLSLLLLLPGAPIAFIDAATAASQSAAYNDQTANLVAFAAKVIKTSQTSGCDGEQLQISCPPDYTITIITADLTILAPAHQQQAAAAAANQSSGDATPGNQCAPTTASVVATNGVDSQQQQPQLAAGAGSGSQQAAADALGGATYANLTTGAWCEASEGNASARANQQLVLDAVRASCQQRVGSCQLNLAPEVSGAAAPPVGAQRSLGRLLQESCPRNRKLLEVAYKCRAQKFTRRTVCRGDKMRLECPQDKRIAILSGLYGSLPAETKINERCLSSSMEDFNGANSQQLAAVSIPPLVSNATTYKACGTQNDTLKTLMLKCAGLTRCALDVTTQVFGETNCSLGQPEYVMFHFLCVPSNLMRPDWLRNDSMVANGVAKPREPSPSIFAGGPSNPSSWSLNPNPIGTQGSASGRNVMNSGADADLVQTSPAFTTVASGGDPQATIGGQNDPRRSQDWSLGDNLHLWLRRFEQEIALSVGCGLLVLIASLLVARKLVSHGHSRRQTNLSVSSKNSANSTCSNSAASTHSSHSPPMATAHAHMNHYHTHHPHVLVPHPRHAQQQQAGASHQSCFSLDELQAVGGGGGGHSPAASGADTPSADGNSGAQLVPPTYHTAAGTMAAGGLQPRLWSIYQATGRQQQSLNAANTLRPTRTFVGAQQPQPPQPPQLFQQQHSQHPHQHQHQCLLQHQTLGWTNQQQQPCAQINAGAQLELQLLQANAATTQCAFHQQQHQLHQQFLQQQQQQQPIVLAPPELEPTIGESVGEQQQSVAPAPYLTLSSTQAANGQFQPQQPVLYQQQQQQQQ